MSFRSKQDFDFDIIKDITGEFDPEHPAPAQGADEATLAARGAASAGGSGTAGTGDTTSPSRRG